MARLQQATAKKLFNLLILKSPLLFVIRYEGEVFPWNRLLLALHKEPLEERGQKR